MSTVARRPSALRVAEIAAWTVGLALLALYGGLRIRHTTAARREVREFKEAKALDRGKTLEQGKAFGDARTLSWGAPNLSLWSPERVRAWHQNLAAAAPAAVAVLRIPKIGLEVPVLEGTDDASLDSGVGHIEGTASPGAPGNVGIAGHRDGFFRGLKDVSPGDAIEVETRTRTYRYVVNDLVVVDPQDVWVLDQTSSERLTLVTCFPFYYTGSAPRRFIVQAQETAAR
ncbi:MAG TPA: class D sortase [Thermoanaerobaculia bacterium]|nr:class D sortase [Thermoanaerobaculia bacterium]